VDFSAASVRAARAVYAVKPDVGEWQ
jgi:hypothetical protein